MAKLLTLYLEGEAVSLKKLQLFNELFGLGAVISLDKQSHRVVETLLRQPSPKVWEFSVELEVHDE